MDTSFLPPFQLKNEGKIMQCAFNWFRMIPLLMLIGMSMSVIPVNATIFTQDGSNLTTTDLYNLTNSTKPVLHNESVVFFYDPNCSPCIPVHEYLAQYLSDNPETEVEMVNLSEGQEAEDHMNILYMTHNREWMNTPVIFIGPIGLEGTDEIITSFESVYTWYTKTEK
ncbi:MAG: hypothetical protein CVV33_01505 [Methanomicrobiales archaeon HGW-Methanomicrobiales-4]|nr:MAG: hypothetical protein CVV33_01505 [Methanomicrobiales archaeon HGW-Methanomicrobiales-4]